MDKKISKIKVLDGLRGYAALMIVLAHLPQISDSAIGYWFCQAILAFKIGYLGVDIFFVLSGFLITRILLLEKRNGTFSFKTFFIKRALRIFPIYYLAIVVCGILFSWHGMGFMAVYLSNYYFAFVDVPHPLRHTWSLAIEEHYYLIWPFLLYSFKPKIIQKIIPFVVLVIVIGSLMVTYWVFDHSIANKLVYRGTQFRILSLSVGSLFAFYETQLSKLSRVGYVLLVGSLGFIYGISILIHKTVWIEIFPKPAILLVLFSVCSSLFFLVVLFQEEQKNIWNFIFTNKMIVFIGKISYGLYLYHYIVFYFFDVVGNPSEPFVIAPSRILLPILLAFLVSILSYYVIEKPILRYKSRWAK